MNRRPANDTSRASKAQLVFQISALNRDIERLLRVVRSKLDVVQALAAQLREPSEAPDLAADPSRTVTLSTLVRRVVSERKGVFRVADVVADVEAKFGGKPRYAAVQMALRRDPNVVSAGRGLYAQASVIPLSPPRRPSALRRGGDAEP